jgi:hypothetical protein
MWDVLFIVITLTCFTSGVLYVRACQRIGKRPKEDRNHA